MTNVSSITPTSGTINLLGNCYIGDSSTSTSYRLKVDGSLYANSLDINDHAIVNGYIGYYDPADNTVVWKIQSKGTSILRDTIIAGNLLLGNSTDTIGSYKLEVKGSSYINGVLTVTDRVIHPNKCMKIDNSTSGSYSPTLDAANYDVTYIYTKSDIINNISFRTYPQIWREHTVIIVPLTNHEISVLIPKDNIFRTPTGEDIEIVIPGGGYGEISFLYDGSRFYVRGA